MDVAASGRDRCYGGLGGYIFIFNDPNAHEPGPRIELYLPLPRDVTFSIDRDLLEKPLTHWPSKSCIQKNPHEADVVERLILPSRSADRSPSSVAGFGRCSRVGLQCHEDPHLYNK